MLRINPLTAGEHYIGKIVVSNHSWTNDASWLLSPVLGATVFAGAAIAAARSISLRGGSTS